MKISTVSSQARIIRAAAAAANPALRPLTSNVALGARTSALRFRAQMPHYAILHCYDTPKWWPLGSSLWQESLQDASDPLERWSTYDVVQGQLPDLSGNIDGVVITGSARGAYEDIPWIHKLSEWIRAAAAAAESGSRMRVVGGCFGAQLLAHSLGGLVEPQGFSLLCAESIQLTPAYAAAQWGGMAEGATGAGAGAGAVGDEGRGAGAGAGAGATPSASRADSVRLIESHGDCVRALPPGGVLLGTSGSCVNEFFSVGSFALGIQSHPEFDVDRVVDPILWPQAAETMTDEEKKKARDSFAEPRDESRVLDAIRRFLKGK